MKFKILLSLSFTTLLFACKKDKDYSVKGYLNGSWKLTELAVDQNQNQVIDSGERIQLQKELVQIIFKGDGTGTGNLNYSNYYLGVNFTWTTDEPEKLLYIHARENSLNGKVFIENASRFRLTDISSNSFGNNASGLIQVFERK